MTQQPSRSRLPRSAGVGFSDYSVLHAVFAYAVASDRLGRSPGRNIKLPTILSTRHGRLDDDQVEIARYRAMAWVAAGLGLAVVGSEAAALRVGFVDLLRGTAALATH